MITIQHDINPEDYRRAVFLHLRPRPVIGMAGLLVLALLGVGFYFQLTSSEPWEFSTFVMLGAPVYVLLYFFVVIPWRVNKSVKQNRLLDHDAQCMIDEVGLHTQSDLGTSDIPWDHFHKCKESRRLLLLYFTDTMYLILPRHLFDAEGWEELRGLAGRHLKEVRWRVR